MMIEKAARFCAATLLFTATAFAQVKSGWLRQLDFANRYDVLNGIATDELGNLYLTGSSYDPTAGPQTAGLLTIKLDRLGRQVWTNFENSHVQGGFRIAARGGFVWVVGGRGQSDTNWLISRYQASDGAKLWELTLDPGHEDGATAMAFDPAGNLIVTGATQHEYPDNDRDYYTAKIDADGTLLWSTAYHAAEWSAAVAIAVDGSGDAYVTGSSNDPSTHVTNMVTIKYSGSSGAEQWVARYRPGQSSYGTALVTYTAQDLYVTGSHDGATVVNRYRTSDGTALWSHHYAASPFAEGPSDIALDAIGDVYVTGVWDPNGGYDLNDNVFAVKFRREDGAQLWASTFGDDAPGAEESAIGAFVSPLDGLYLPMQTPTGFVLLRYALANGALLDQTTVNDGSWARLATMDRRGQMFGGGWIGDATSWDFLAVAFPRPRPGL